MGTLASPTVGKRQAGLLSEQQGTLGGPRAPTPRPRHSRPYADQELATSLHPPQKANIGKITPIGLAPPLHMFADSLEPPLNGCI